jgi:hypothetical protein
MSCSSHSCVPVLFFSADNYERSTPVYQGVPTSGAPLYITHGAGGNREGIEDNWSPAPVWSAIQASVVGVGELQVTNSTMLQWSFVKQLNQTGVEPLQNVQQIDQVWIPAKGRTTEAWKKHEERMQMAAGTVEAPVRRAEIALE